MKITLTAKELLALHGLVNILSASEIAKSKGFKNNKSNVVLTETADGGVIVEVNQELFYHVANALVSKAVMAVPMLKMFGGMFKSLGADMQFIGQRYMPNFNTHSSYKNVEGVEIFEITITDNEIESFVSYPEYYTVDDCNNIGRILVDIYNKISKELKTVDASAAIEISNLEKTLSEVTKLNREVSEKLGYLRSIEK